MRSASKMSTPVAVHLEMIQLDTPLLQAIRWRSKPLNRMPTLPRSSSAALRSVPV